MHGEAERNHETYTAAPGKAKQKYFRVYMFCILCTKCEEEVMTVYQSVTIGHYVSS
jgi:hypothetical protein